MNELPSTDPQSFSYIHSNSFPTLLETLGISLFVSTYQAGRLMVIRAEQGKLTTLLRNFVQAMGLALTPHRLALGTRNQIHLLRNAPALSLHSDSAADNTSYDACYIPRLSYTTGDIRVHELVWVDEQLWIVNTRFSCLCTLHPDYSFVPQWHPPFITALEGSDRCHLNGVALVNQQPRYVTAFSQTNSPQGWRSHKIDGGCILQIPTGDVVAHGFSMPHSPRFYDNRLWLLNSGHGHLVNVDLESGKSTIVAALPGFTRGLAFYGRYAFIGLSQIREKQTFGGLPLEEKHNELKCGVWAIDIKTGEIVAFLEFQEGCTELFDIQVLATAQKPMILGFQRDEINNAFLLQN